MKLAVSGQDGMAVSGQDGMAVRLKGRKRGGPAVPETVGYVVNSSPGSATRRAIGVQPVVAPAAHAGRGVSGR